MLRLASPASVRTLCPVLCLFLFLVCSVAAHAHGHGHKRPSKTGILVVAFGTSMPEAREAYDNLDALVKEQWPETPVRWAYTSKMVRHKLAKQGQELPSVAEALAQMADEDFTRVAVLSTHIIPGEEYHGLVRTAHAFAGMPKGTREVLVSHPLLATSKQLTETARAILDTFADKRKEGQALVLMGHGTHHPGDVIYAALQYHFSRLDQSVIVGTVEGTPTFEDVAAMLAEKKMKNALLVPLMTVAGDHAQNDMAGKEAASLKSMLEAKGIACETAMKGLAEYDSLASLWLRRFHETMSHFE